MYCDICNSGNIYVYKKIIKISNTTIHFLQYLYCTSGIPLIWSAKSFVTCLKSTNTEYVKTQMQLPNSNRGCDSEIYYLRK